MMKNIPLSTKIYKKKINTKRFAGKIHFPITVGQTNDSERQLEKD